MRSEYENRIKDCKEITLGALEKEFCLQQKEASYSLNHVSFLSNEKQIIDFENKNVCKVFSSVFQNVDFIGIQLSAHAGQDQRMMEGNIYIDCSFINCSQIASFNECIFENCTFNHCDFKTTNFISCKFINTTAGECDFFMANFSLSNYQDIFIDSCNIEKTLLCQKEAEQSNHTQHIVKYQELGFNLLEYALRLIYDSMQLNEDTQMLLDPIAHNLSEYIKENKGKFEKEGVKEKDEDAIYKWLELHETWANQIIRLESDKPEIDWKYNDYSNMDFKDRNLSEIDFTGSILKNCDFSGANLTGVNFTDCNLNGTVLYKAIFADNKFEKAHLENVLIDSKNLSLFQQAGIAINTNHTGVKPVVIEQLISADGKKMI